MKGRAFVCEPHPRVVRDGAHNAPALLLGWWVGTAGEEAIAEVLTLSTQRPVRQLAGWHGEPVQPPRGDRGAA